MAHTAASWHICILNFQHAQLPKKHILVHMFSYSSICIYVVAICLDALFVCVWHVANVGKVCIASEMLVKVKSVVMRSRNDMYVYMTEQSSKCCYHVEFITSLRAEDSSVQTCLT